MEISRWDLIKKAHDSCVPGAQKEAQWHHLFLELMSDLDGFLLCINDSHKSKSIPPNREQLLVLLTFYANALRSFQLDKLFKEELPLPRLSKSLVSKIYASMSIWTIDLYSCKKDSLYIIHTFSFIQVQIILGCDDSHVYTIASKCLCLCLASTHVDVSIINIKTYPQEYALTSWMECLILWVIRFPYSPLVIWKCIYEIYCPLHLYICIMRILRWSYELRILIHVLLFLEG